MPEETSPGETPTDLDLLAPRRQEFGCLNDVVFRVGIDNAFNETYAIYPNQADSVRRGL